MTESVISSVECWACSNGLIVFSTDIETGNVLLECEECMAGSWEPDVVSGGKPPFLTVDMLTRASTLDEIRVKGWSPLIRNC
ncbi:hypothetical protein ACFUNF_35105 [Streptomyces sp. NPDC057291]|uniref:hypothetical protein n=1 Tax=Streptomyces sp. NPDC057291 TaxID=3346087 RepID=UPI003639D099